MLKHTECDCTDGKRDETGFYCDRCNWEFGCITCASDDGIGDNGYCEECEFENAVAAADQAMDLAQDK